MSIEAQDHSREVNVGLHGGPLRVGREEFLRRVREDFAISRIYYPGVGCDRQLERPFSKKRVFPLDKYIWSDMRKMRNCVIGDMKQAPFPDNVFDAVFIHDIHAKEAHVEDILRTLRPNGIVIFILDDAVEENLYDDLALLKEHPHLEPLRLSYQNKRIRVFRKEKTPALDQ